MKQKNKNRPAASPTSQALAWLIALTLASSVFVVTFHTADSTILKPVVLYLFVTLIAAFSLWRFLSAGELTIRWNQIHLFALGWLCSAVVSVLTVTSLRFATEAIIFQTSLILLFIATQHAFEEEKDRILLFQSLFVISVVAVVLGILGNTLGLSGRGMRGPVSTFGNPSYLAGFLVGVFPFTLAAILRPELVRIPRLISAVLCFAMLVLLVQTQTRSAWIAVAFGCVALILAISGSRRTRWLLMSAGVVIFLAIFFLFQDLLRNRLLDLLELGPQSTLARRWFFYEASWSAFLHSPMIGNGIGNFILFMPRFRNPDYWIYKSEDIAAHAHNEALEILSEQGIFGFLMFLGLILFIGRGIFRSIQDADGTRRARALAIGASMLAICVDNLANVSLRTVPTAVLFWIMAGYTVALNGTRLRVVRIIIPAQVCSFRFLPIAMGIAFIFFLTNLGIERVRSSEAVLRADMLHHFSKSPEAASLYQLALEMNPSEITARLNLASNLFDHGRFNEARIEAETLLKLYPWFPKAHLLIAAASIELGDTSEILKHIDAERSLRDHPQVDYYLASYYGRLGRNDEEFMALRNMVSKSVKSKDRTYISFGLTRMIRLASTQEKLDEIQSLIDDSARVFPEDTEIRKTIEDLRLSISSMPTQKHRLPR